MSTDSDLLYVDEYVFACDYEYRECFYDMTEYTLTIMPKLSHNIVCCLLNIDDSIAFGCLDSGVI